MTHEEIRNLRQKWNDIITNYPNDLFNSITGKRWSEVYVDFKEYKKSILEATIPGNIPVHNELSQLKHAVAILTDFFNKTDERIKILRIKNTQVVDEIIQSIIADGEKNYKSFNRRNLLSPRSCLSTEGNFCTPCDLVLYNRASNHFWAK